MPTTRLPLTIVATPTEEAALVSALRLALAVSEVGDARKGARGLPLSRVQREAVRRILARGVARRRRTKEEVAMSKETVPKEKVACRIEVVTSYVCRVCGNSYDTEAEAALHDEEMRVLEERRMAEAVERCGVYIGKELPVYMPRRYPTPGDELVLRGKQTVKLVELKRVGHGVALVVEPGVPVLVPCSYDSEYRVDLETHLRYWGLEGGALWLSDYGKDYAYLEVIAEEWEKTGKRW